VPDLEDLLRVAARAAGLAALHLVEPLGGSPRSLVGRVGDGTATYVVKVSRESEETWARESCALEAAAGSGVSPRLLGADRSAGLVVMSDLGAAPPVSDRLMAPAGAGTARSADEGLVAWARAVARLHRDGAARADRYATLLAATDPRVPAHAIPRTLDEATTEIAATLGDLGVTDVAAGLHRLRELPSRLTSDSVVLSPGDACPDNNVMDPTGTGGGTVTLLDFEYAEARHRAWDLAYLTVPWPTCWCSWRIPPEGRDRALAAYCATAEVDRAELEDDLALATQGWALMTGGRMVRPALSGEPWDVPEMPGPALRARDRLETASRGPDVLLAAVARTLLAAVGDRWRRSPLPLAPAYRPPG
jgi:hypothetical protein